MIRPTPATPTTAEPRLGRAGLALVAVVTTAAGVRLFVDGRTHSSRHPAIHVAAGVGSLVVAGLGGASAGQLGLGRGSRRRGITIGSLVAGLLAPPIVAALSHPVTDRGIDRVGTPPPERSTSFEVLVRIPLNTAFYEEAIFRGALHGLMERIAGRETARWTTAIAFGLWHIPEALSGRGRHDASDGRARTVDALVAVGATTIAGLALTELRLRTRSILAPVVVHAAVNGAAHAAVHGGNGS